MKTNKSTSMTLRKNDTVQVVTGQFKGVTGKVMKIDRDGNRVVVENERLKVKKHTKASQKNPGGGVILVDRMIHRSNILLFCAKCSRGVRHGVRVDGKDKTAKKVRFCRKCNETLDQA